MPKNRNTVHHRRSVWDLYVDHGQCICSFVLLHLTDKGRGIARKIYERHRFFTEQLIEAGFEAEIAEQEACQIEHAISQESFEILRDSYNQNKEKKTDLSSKTCKNDCSS